MIKKTFFILLLFLTNFSYSQITFEAGYFIDSTGEKKDVLIKNIDWDSNPEEFSYKTSQNATEQLHDVTSVKEFGVYNESRYVSALVNIDRSSNQNSKLTSYRRAVFTEERLFLKEVLIGEASLYRYKSGNLFRYFFTLENNEGNYEQLVFKRFIPEGTTIKVNERYKQQLTNILKCESVSATDIKAVKYEKNSLVALFKKYNTCVDPEKVYVEDNKSKVAFHISLRPGLKSSSLEFIDSGIFRDISFDFGNMLGVRFGVEAELVLPFNKNKWAFIFEPTYQSFQSDDDTSENTVDYKSIEVPIGLRHYLFLKNSKFYINGGMVLDNPINSSLNGRESTFSSNIMYGVGFVFNEKYGIELRRQSRRDIISRFVGSNGDYFGNFEVILSIQVF
ncbi:hypothetical protein MTsPCn5_23210 [Croceitalea sp. MTPC5]|uniref:tRNA modification GTPase n=1 Tax=Croceitalea sp. MTPC5 TaxID=3056565 RepID=UPI002B3A91BF|nr:hypothetical protein MTsPCn5_23210 [Croceitalea sp. MTPC5]